MKTQLRHHAASGLASLFYREGVQVLGVLGVLDLFGGRHWPKRTSTVALSHVTVLEAGEKPVRIETR